MRDAEVRELVARVEELLGGIDGDPAALEAVRAIVELYGEALARFVAGADPVQDELLSHLLLVHDLHPVEVETRVARALETAGGAELVEVADGVARVRLGKSCSRAVVEQAVLRAAPELERVEAVVESKLLQIGSFR